MYDSIGLFQQGYSIKEGLLTNLRESYDQKTGEVILRGSLANLQIKNIGENVSVLGSLPKFYFGDNLQQLTRKDTELALEKLSDSLQLPVKESKVFRLDIGANFLLNEPLQNYYSCLGALARFKKSQMANNQTLIYSTTAKALELYDKQREMKRKKETLPEIFSGKNVLRYELQLRKRVSNSLKVAEVKASDLYQEAFYIKGIDFWKDIYFKIGRINKMTINNKAIKKLNVKTTQKLLSLIGLKLYGEEEFTTLILSMIESDKNLISNRQEVYRIKESIRALANEPELTKPNESIKELDEKVLRASRYYR